MQITLIRHLPTEWNKKEMLQGRKDIAISAVTDEALKEISNNKQILETLPPTDLVLASTLSRTHQTARLYGYEPESERLLDELDFGPFEGKSKQELRERFGDLWTDSPRELVLGESLKNLEQRIEVFLEKYHPYHHILVFGHGSWIRAMVSYWQYGNINHMNKITVGNNQCIILSVSK